MGDDVEMVRFKAIAKGYYDDVIHDPETDHNVFFNAPATLECSWAVRADGEETVSTAAEVSDETLNAEAILDTESAAAAPVDADEVLDVETL